MKYNYDTRQYDDTQPAKDARNHVSADFGYRPSDLQNAVKTCDTRPAMAMLLDRSRAMVEHAGLLVSRLEKITGSLIGDTYGAEKVPGAVPTPPIAGQLGDVAISHEHLQDYLNRMDRVVLALEGVLA